MIPKWFVAYLQQLGSGEAPLRTDRFPNSRAARRVLLCGNEPWAKVASALDEPELSALTRGLVLFGNHIGFSGGSVSPVIVTYAIYARQFSASEPRLTRWIVANRTNTYEPFGTMIHGNTTTMAEFHAYRVDRESRRQSAVAVEQLRQQEAGSLKRLRDAELATQRLSNAVRRGDLAAVTVLLSRGARWRDVVRTSGSLVALATANGRDHVAEYLASQGIP